MQPLPKIKPVEVRYIKLGPGNRWASLSIANNRIPFGHKEVPHELAEAGDWEAAKARLSGSDARSPAKATDFVREIREFYTLGADCLWITFVDDKLWWAFAEPEVIAVTGDPDIRGARYRRVIDRWRCENIKGETISIHDLSTKLTKTGTYRQTLCRVEHADYAVRIINGEEDPAVLRARVARRDFTGSLVPLIRSLHQNDFELLTDLLFARLGWARVSIVGGTMKDVDLVLEQPESGARGLVQVKSSADQSVLDASIDRLRSHDGAERFFVCHTPRGTLAGPEDDDHFHVWSDTTLARRVVEAGLVDWLISRAA